MYRVSIEDIFIWIQCIIEYCNFNRFFFGICVEQKKNNDAIIIIVNQIEIYFYIRILEL